MPEVIEFYRLSGSIDYLLKVLVSSMDEYNAFYTKLTVESGASHSCWNNCYNFFFMFIINSYLNEIIAFIRLFSNFKSLFIFIYSKYKY